MNDIKDDLQETLQRHAGDLYGAPLSLDHVRTRARRIQRNRRLAVAGGIAAALVVIVPAGMLAAGDLGGGSDTAPPIASNGPSPTKAEDPQLEPSGVGIAYAHGTALTMPDGTEVHLPHPYQQVVVAGGEVYGAQPDPDTGYWKADVIGTEGVTDSFVATSQLVPDAAGTVVTWATPKGELKSRANGVEAVIQAKVGEVAPQAITGGPDCAEQADGCTVYFTGTQGEQLATHSGAGINEVLGAPMKVDDATADGLVAMQTSAQEDTSCSGVLDQSSGDYTFTTCKNTLTRFSPDGAYVAAGPDYLSGNGTGFAAILDAQTGKNVGQYAPEGGFVWSTQWEDATHLLVLQHDGSGWSVKRLSVGGEIEDVLGPDDSTDELTPAYVLGGLQ